MKPPDFIKYLQVRTAVVAIGPSALRGQGKGVLRATQDYLRGLDLRRVPRSTPHMYARWLDRQTARLLDVLPVRNRPWGAARKALNLFMRDVLYNKYLNTQFGMDALEPWLEIPLDSAVARGLAEYAGRGALPRWPGLKHLTPEVSRAYQDCAAAYARSRGVARVHADVSLWLENRA